MNKTFTESCQTQFGGSFDIIVVGGGPSGACAAIAAGNCGAKVLLIEKTGCLGGQWTNGFVNPFFDHANKIGLVKQMREYLQKKNKWGSLWNTCMDTEEIKYLLEEWAQKAQVSLLYYTSYVGVKCVGNRVCGVTVENISGRCYYEANIVIDATGDACVAADAGAEIQIGRANDASCQAMTLMFVMRPIPEKYRRGHMFFEELKKAFEKQGEGKEPVYEKPFIIPIPGTDAAVIQYTHMRGYNPLSAKDLTAATVEGRKQAHEAVEALRNFDSDFADLSLLTTAPMLGVRESRRIVGEYTLTVEDALSGAQFDDGLTVATFNIDIHEASNTTQDCRAVQPYQIPYRSLIPKGAEGLLVVGRCISGTHEAMASYRVTGNCAEMGEAAGYAAYEAMIARKSVREVAIGDIKKHFPQ